jgi:hypothetical protein
MRQPSRAREFYRLAAQARRLAAAADDPDQKLDLLEVEEGWLSLARPLEPDLRLRGQIQNQSEVEDGGS